MSLSFSLSAFTAFFRVTFACVNPSAHPRPAKSSETQLRAGSDLCHHELDVLALQALVVNLLVVILVVVLGSLNGLALIDRGSGHFRFDIGRILGLAELLGSIGLGLRIQILNLGLTEYAILTSETNTSGDRERKEKLSRLTHIQVLLEGDLYTSGLLITYRIYRNTKWLLASPIHRQDRTTETRHTFFGRRRVTRVIPGTCFKPNLAMDLRAFFSLREWTATADPAGISPPSPSPVSDSSEDSWSSTSTFLTCSSVISSIRGSDITWR